MSTDPDLLAVPPVDADGARKSGGAAHQPPFAAVSELEDGELRALSVTPSGETETAAEHDPLDEGRLQVLLHLRARGGTVRARLSDRRDRRLRGDVDRRSEVGDEPPAIAFDERPVARDRTDVRCEPVTYEPGILKSPELTLSEPKTTARLRCFSSSRPKSCALAAICHGRKTTSAPAGMVATSAAKPVSFALTDRRET